MWSIRERKQRALGWVRFFYGAAYGACLIPFVVEAVRSREMNPFAAALPEGTLAQQVQHLPFLQQLFLLFSFSMLTLLWGAIGLLVKYLLLNPLEVGLCRYFLRSREQGAAAGFGVIFSVFTGKEYWNLVKILFLRDLYLFGWFLLLIIPGIYKSYEYRLIPYLLAEYPHLTAHEAFAETRERMEGNRMQGFLLDFSFLGWNLLAGIVGAILSRGVQAAFFMLPGALPLCIGAWISAAAAKLVAPYENAAWTEVYLYLEHSAYQSEPESF